VPYLLLGLQDVQWAVGNSRGARKLARTPHVNQKKKITVNFDLIQLLDSSQRDNVRKSWMMVPNIPVI
jgi:hypothetical protein